MSQKSIREYDGKRMISRWLQANASPSSNLKATESRFVQVTPNTSFDKLAAENPWLLTEKLVVKPDQLIKRRGKGGLILLNADWEAVKSWIADRMEKEINIEGVRGVLNTFIVEPFCPHDTENDEYYFCIRSVREGDELLFYYKGGIEVGNVDEKADKMLIEIGDLPTADQFLEKLPSLREKVPQQRSQLLASFFEHMFKFYSSLYYAYFEINPVVVVQDRVVPLDLAAKIDSTADFEQGPKEWWGNISFPPPFGRPLLPEEQYIQELDSKTGASLKLTILNMKGRIWTMVAGGGASVVYADTISDLGFGHELANYGEYSGDPSESLTYEYAKTIIGLMTREKDERGKILIIGGGIANFTNVAETFKGIIRALTEFKHQLIETGVKIYVRRGGPNYQQGLKMMKHLGKELGIPIQVYGPETHITYIVSIALGMAPPEATTQPPLHADWPHRIQAVDTPKDSNSSSSSSNPRAFVPNDNEQQDGSGQQQQQQQGQNQNHAHYPGGEDGPDKRGAARPWYELFYSGTRSIVYGMQERAVQGMLDFDHLCGRKVPSVAAMIYPFAGNHFHKFYWGGSEMLLPVFSSLSEAVKKFPEVDTIINFASFRSVYQSTMEALQFTDQIRTIAIIAEGVPENRTKMLIKKAKQHNVTIIGPATVGGIKPGCFRIGNTGGMLDNILSSKLYRPGNVAFVSRSGGMSNELNNIISRNSNGTYEGIAIGGDRYPGTTFIDHMLRFQEDPEVKMLVLLGEVGGIEEYEIVKALKSGKINKPLVAWCVGTCAKMFPYEVQFGHAGALAHGQSETAGAKNEALREAGAVVPKSFNEFGQAIRQVYTDLVERGIIVEKPEPEPPTIPMDYSWAQKLGLIRKPASFVSSVSDERGEELLYAGMPISAVFKEDIGVGGVLSLLWFRRLLPKYACKFIEMILQLVADHGPAVAGAHNTIVTARAGKDLVSSLVAGLLTVGPRFGGAVDEAAQQFTEAYDANLSPQEFVDSMRKKNKLISGIGHKIKSLQNPDMRVTILKDFVFANFNNYELLKFALEVEKVTTAKKANLILNVDGCIGVAFVDLMRSCGAFTREEVDEYIKVGCLNGLFVLGRSIGLIGHYMDQKLLKQGLYRHPWDDISYVVPQKEQRPDGW